MTIDSKYIRPDHHLPVLFLSVLLLTGIFIYRDYGISWDEPQQRNLGLVTWNYLFKGDTSLLHDSNCYLNPFIGLLEVVPEKILRLSGDSDIYASRHLFNFIFCWIGLIFFYLLAQKFFHDYRFALLVCLLFILTPRLFAHCFYNSKDLPFLSLFVVNVYLFVSWLQRASWSKIIWMVIFSGMLTGARIAGILFPIIVFVTIIVHWLAGNLKRKETGMIAAYLIFYLPSVYLFFPTFWHHPFQEFTKAIEVMSHHPYEVTTFFMGETIHSLHTPWYYIPVWMGITIPIGWWIFFFAGVIFLTASVICNKEALKVQWFAIVLWLLVPLITQLILHSSTYDDGRHLFFIYPAFLVIVVYGIRSIIQEGFQGRKFLLWPVRIVSASIFFFTIVYVTAFMIRFHPYQYAYFNAVGRKYASDYFEKDYWGLSFRSGLEFLAKYDRSPSLNVRWKVDPGEWNLAWLKDDDRKRFHFVPYVQCDYYLTTYRTHRPQDASNEKIYEVKVQNITIMAVYKMHPPNPALKTLP